MAEKLLWSLVLLALLSAAAFGAVALYPPLYPAGLALVGRSELCSFAGAFAGAQKRFQLSREVERMAADVELLRREDGLSLWSTPAGSFWLPDGSDAVLPILAAQQRVDIYGATGAAKIAPGAVVLDCGAHVGVYVRKALDQGAATVVAIEPAPDNIECLRRNFAAEIEQGRVIVRAEGVWDRPDKLPLFTKRSNSAADSFVMEADKEATSELLPLTTIDLIVEELSLERVDIVKMDIKGATGRALAGARRTLERWRPALALSTEEEADDPAELIGLLHALGYTQPPRCGHCSIRAGRRVAPDAILFESGR